MSVKNLHSLINGRWFIHEQYGHSLLPSLFSIIEGRSITIAPEEREPDVFISAGKSTSKVIVASSFESDTNNAEYVAIINLKDPIYKYDQECGPRGTKSKANSMRKFEQDPNCVGVVLDIDSGGGQVSGTPEFYDFVKAFSKPVVAYTDGYMCSAAYYIGSATSHIIANKRADCIGSIGVMVHFIDVSGMYEKLGAKVITEYSTLSPDKNKAFEELLKGNPELYIKTELDPCAEDFANDIKAVRPDADKAVFGGGTWNAADALSKKLIDQVGTFQDAVDKVFALSKTSKLNPNSNMSKKTKSFPAIQGLLAIEGEGIATVSELLGASGVAISEAQLEVLESTLVANATAVTALATKEADLTAANGKVTTAEGRTTAIEAAIATVMTDSKITAEAGATVEANIAKIGAEMARLALVPGANIAKPKSEGDGFDKEDDVVNAADAHNEMYNKA